MLISSFSGCSRPMLAFSPNHALALAFVLSTNPWPLLAARPNDLAEMRPGGALALHHHRVVLARHNSESSAEAVTSLGATAAPHSRLAPASAEGDAAVIAAASEVDARLEELRQELLSERTADAVATNWTPMQQPVAAAPEDSPVQSRTESENTRQGRDTRRDEVAGAVLTFTAPISSLASNGMAGWYCAGIIAVLSVLATSTMYFHLNHAQDRRHIAKSADGLETRSPTEAPNMCKQVQEVEKSECTQAHTDVQNAAEEAQERNQQAKFDSFDAGGLSQECLPIPESFKCPITKEIMVDPVSTVDGLTYERESILAWFRLGNRTSPLTNMALPSLQLTKNIALKCAISEFRRLRPELQRRELQRRDFEAAVMDREKELEDLADKCSQVLEQKEAEIKEQNFRVAMLQVQASTLSRHLAAKDLAGMPEGPRSLEVESSHVEQGAPQMVNNA